MACRRMSTLFYRIVEGRFTDTGCDLGGGRDRVVRWASSLITVSSQRQYEKGKWIADCLFLRY